MSITIIPADRNGPPIAKAVIAGDTIYVTVVPDDENGDIVNRPILEQARLVFGNLRETLAECESSMEDVVHVTVYLPDLTDRDDMTRAWVESFHPRYPGRATIGVAALAHPDMKIEITAIAHRG
ncbi:Reactive intermediate/imine deaminase OS=Castellaniella defragrans OX=75697 GN=HNR28_002166 PE=3 SV=1 [Castellaniella defragrans]